MISIMINQQLHVLGYSKHDLIFMIHSSCSPPSLWKLCRIEFEVLSLQTGLQTLPL